MEYLAIKFVNMQVEFIHGRIVWQLIMNSTLRAISKVRNNRVVWHNHTHTYIYIGVNLFFTRVYNVVTKRVLFRQKSLCLSEGIFLVSFVISVKIVDKRYASIIIHWLEQNESDHLLHDSNEMKIKLDRQLICDLWMAGFMSSALLIYKHIFVKLHKDNYRMVIM